MTTGRQTTPRCWIQTTRTAANANRRPRTDTDANDLTSTYQIETKQIQEIPSAAASGYNEPDVQAPGMIRLQDLLRDMGYPEGKAHDNRAIFGPHGHDPALGYITQLHTKLRKLGYDNNKKRDYYFTMDELAEVKKLITEFFDSVPRIKPRGPNKKKSKMFQIFVKTIIGKTVTLDCLGEFTVAEVKKMIEEKQKVSNAKAHHLPNIREVQRLDFNGLELEDARALSDYNISNASTLWESGRLQGGARDPPQDTS